MKAKESISFPMDFETYYAQYCACVRRCTKAEREERLSKTSKGRRFAEQFLLFLGMAALAFFIGKELVDSLGASHPATWTAIKPLGFFSFFRSHKIMLLERAFKP